MPIYLVLGKNEVPLSRAVLLSNMNETSKQATECCAKELTNVCLVSLVVEFF